MADNDLPTDAQKQTWDRFSDASKKAAEATKERSGKARMKARAKLISDMLENPDD